MDTFKNGKPYPPDEICIPNWDSLISIYHDIPKKHKDQKAKKEAYSSLKKLAITKILTERQLEGILARCEYQIGQIDNPTKEDRQRVEGLEQFQKMRGGKFSANGNGK